MKRITVTGASGQLGNALRELWPEGDLFPQFIDKEELDITNAGETLQYFKTNPADIIINCAAYTDVARAEDEPLAAFAVNTDGVANLAEAAKSGNAKMIHISTDYVFDGAKKKPYVESDREAPLNVYGISKVAGEARLREILPDAVLIRTSWLYSPFGKNFFLTMKNKALAGEEARVVADQFGTPTSAHDLAKALLKIVSCNNWEPGIYHFSGSGETTWYEFAREIYSLYGADHSLVSPVTTRELGGKVKRPPYSVLDAAKIKETFAIDIPHWKESLKQLADQTI